MDITYENHTNKNQLNTRKVLVEHMHYKVKIDGFEGPLDLLLHLINHLEVDIYDIPVADITEQYMIYIHAMKELQLDVASEYLVMAATLLEIKSKMLLPNHNKDFDEELMIEMEEDPREELVEKLIEYRKYKEIAEDLKILGEERSLLFTKPPSDLTEYAKELKSRETRIRCILIRYAKCSTKAFTKKKTTTTIINKNYSSRDFA